MNAKIREIEITEPRTVPELVVELGLTTTPVLLAINGVAFHPDVVAGRELKKGDRVTIIPLVAGG